MKKLALALCLVTLTGSTFAQGLVNFFNNSSTLVSVGYPPTLTSTTPGTYYFGLFEATPGTTDLNAFRFTGVYATNQAVAGRFTGGGNVAVPGWQPGVFRSFYVAGWSAELGHDPTEILSGVINGPFTEGWFGGSEIAIGKAGGFDGTGTLPNLNLFGSTAIASGLNLSMRIGNIPEPSSLALLALGAAVLLIRVGRRVTETRPQQHLTNPKSGQA